MAVSRHRIERIGSPRPSGGGAFVLYWMCAARRTSYNCALERARTLAQDSGTPLLVVETLACGRRWDSDRTHSFAVDGMADNAAVMRRAGVRYLPFVEREPGEAMDLVEALSERAVAAVADAHPTMGPSKRDMKRLAAVCPAVEAVDSNGLVPLQAAEKVYSSAYSFRRFLQSVLPEHLRNSAIANPLRGRRLKALRRLGGGISKRWPAADVSTAAGRARAIERARINHSVKPVEAAGGAVTARRLLNAFVTSKLSRYAAERNDPTADATSNLSAHLAWGHISAHEVFGAIARREGWSPAKISGRVTGKRSGWWGMSADSEEFLDELVTWRELGFNMCSKVRNFDRYESLPYWARETLRLHAGDKRRYVYDMKTLDSAGTHDRLWNAAQAQLVREGRIHNYMRMLWGKKILEWSSDPAVALRRITELNNRYALDGRNPNSYTGIFWIFGRYDRPWGPERPVYGKVRYMSSENAARKFAVASYIKRHLGAAEP